MNSRLRNQIKRSRLAILLCSGGIAACPLTLTATPVLNPANGHWYDIVSSPGITWDEANDEAGNTFMGGSLCPGHLVTITSADEQNFLVSTFGANALVYKWLGGFQSDPTLVSTGWQWVTGEPWDFTQWNTATGEPNNGYYGSILGYEDATVFWSGGNWNDAPSGWTGYASGGYVVEFECLQVQIDIKPGSYPNSFNSDGNGVIPVAILTTDTFDASTVDPASLTLDGQAVRVKGKSGNSGSLEDVDGDGDLDLVVQFVDVDGTYAVGDSMATVSGKTYDGINISGTDSIRIVPPQ